MLLRGFRGLALLRACPDRARGGVARVGYPSINLRKKNQKFQKIKFKKNFKIMVSVSRGIIFRSHSPPLRHDIQRAENLIVCFGMKSHTYRDEQKEQSSAYSS